MSHLLVYPLSIKFLLNSNRYLVDCGSLTIKQKWEENLARPLHFETYLSGINPRTFRLKLNVGPPLQPQTALKQKNCGPHENKLMQLPLKVHSENAMSWGDSNWNATCDRRKLMLWQRYHLQSRQPPKRSEPRTTRSTELAAYQGFSDVRICSVYFPNKGTPMGSNLKPAG